MKIIDLAKNCIKNEEYYIYAETAFIHEGDKQYLFELIDSAKKSCCDGIKFQILLDVDAAYVDTLDNYQDILKWCFNEKAWTEIISYGREKGLEIIVLPIDPSALIYCINNKGMIDAIELHSIALNDYQLLTEIQKLKDFPVIMGIGGRTIDEIDYALNFILPENIPILMYGMQNFPTSIHAINLSKIQKLRTLYPSFAIGYADHTEYKANGDLLVQLAYSLGAKIFEKHITLKKGDIRLDYEAAVDSYDIIELRRKIETTISIMGDETPTKLNPSENLYRSREKKIVFSKDLSMGTKITDTCLSFKVHPGESDFEQKDINKIIGRHLLRDVSKNKLVEMRDLGESETNKYLSLMKEPNVEDK